MASHVFDVPDFSRLAGPGGTAGALVASQNLSDLLSAAAARTNLGLGSAATQPTSAFDPAGAASAAVAGIPMADATHSGLLKAADWQAFQTAASGSVPTGNLTEATSAVLTITGGFGAVVGSGTAITVKKATTTVDGYLSAADWTTFNNKQNVLGFTPLNPASNLSDLANAVTARTNLGLGSAATQASSAFDVAGAAATAVAAIPNATSTVKGLLTAADWATFNAKQAALTTGNLTELGSNVFTITGGTGAVIGSGVTIQMTRANAANSGYLLASDWSTFNSKQAALTFGNVTESGSSVLLITGGTGAVIGSSGLAIGVKAATTSQSGYLTSADWNTFNGKQAALGFTPLNPSNNLSELVNAATARTNLGLGTAATQASTAFAVLAASNSFTGDIRFPSGNGFWAATANAPTWYEFRTITSQGAALANDYLAYQYNLRSTSGGTDAFADVFQITALTGALKILTILTLSQAPIFTDPAGTRSNLGLGTAAVQNMASMGAMTLAGTLNLGSQAVIGSTLGNLFVGRPANYASAAVNWAINVTNSAGTDNVSLGQSSSTYSTGVIQWIGNNNAYLYFNLSQDFRIGSGVGVTPAMVVQGASSGGGRVLLNTLTDNGADQLQVNGNVNAAGIKASSAVITTGTFGNLFSNILNFSTANAPGWQEFKLFTTAGAAVANDVISFQYNARTTGGGSDSWANVFTISAVTGLITFPNSPIFTAPSGSSGALNAKVAGQATIDLWDTVTGGTPSTGSRWRIFADNVGGGGGSLTFGFYDLANSRSVGGFDNNGWFAVSVGLNIGNAANVNIGSNWQNWSPSVTSFMSLSGISIADAQYLRIGPIVYVKFDISFTCGGSAADRVFVSLPVAPVGNPQIQYAAISFGSANALQATWAYAEASSTTIQVLTNLQSNYPLGFVRFLVNGQYRCL
jgi:hypothetical protein